MRRMLPWVFLGLGLFLFIVGAAFPLALGLNVISPLSWARSVGLFAGGAAQGVATGEAGVRVDSPIDGILSASIVTAIAVGVAVVGFVMTVFAVVVILIRALRRMGRAVLGLIPGTQARRKRIDRKREYALVEAGVDLALLASNEDSHPLLPLVRGDDAADDTVVALRPDAEQTVRATKRRRSR